MSTGRANFYDVSRGISEVRALADTIAHLDLNEAELFKQVSPYLIRILADKVEDLETMHNDFEGELIELRRGRAS